VKVPLEVNVCTVYPFTVVTVPPVALWLPRYLTQTIPEPPLPEPPPIPPCVPPPKPPIELEPPPPPPANHPDAPKLAPNLSP